MGHLDAAGVRIRDVRAIVTAPEGLPLVVVKVETTEPGLHGVGAADLVTRPLTVVSAVQDYLQPLLVGRSPYEIEDIRQSLYQSSYFRGGPVLNTALGGVDTALWDILGKVAGMPVHQLLGGRCRRAVPVYTHAAGSCANEVAEAAQACRERGYGYVRCQVTVPGVTTYGAPSGPQAGDGLWDPAAYRRTVPALFEHLRDALGAEVELLHDVHERLPGADAIGLAKDLEPYRLFFLEDPLSPEDLEHFRLLRHHTSTPLAMGELFSTPQEYLPLVRDRLIDFLRIRVAAAGGVSGARRVAALCEFFGVRMAWQGARDVSPVGHAATIALDIATHNFGIQESAEFNDAAQEVFPGCPTVRDGHYWPPDAPGLGIDIDEHAAAQHPAPDPLTVDAWTRLRLPDGTVTRP